MRSYVNVLSLAAARWLEHHKKFIWASNNKYTIYMDNAECQCIYTLGPFLLVAATETLAIFSLSLAK